MVASSRAARWITAPQQDSEPAQPAEPRDRQVALDRLAEEQALALAVVREVEDARGGRPAGAC